MKLKDVLKKSGATNITIVKLYYSNCYDPTPFYSGKVNHLPKDCKQMNASACKWEDNALHVLFKNCIVVGVAEKTGTDKFFEDARWFKY